MVISSQIPSAVGAQQPAKRSPRTYKLTDKVAKDFSSGASIEQSGYKL